MEALYRSFSRQIPRCCLKLVNGIHIARFIPEAERVEYTGQKEAHDMENGTYHYKIEAAVPLGVRRGSMAVELHNGALSGAINLLERCSPFADGRYKDGAIFFRAYWSR